MVLRQSRDYKVENITKANSYNVFRPTMDLVTAAEYKFFELNAFYWHMVSIILHLINVMLVFFLTKLITENNLCSAAAFR